MENIIKSYEYTCCTYWMKKYLSPEDMIYIVNDTAPIGNRFTFTYSATFDIRDYASDIRHNLNRSEITVLLNEITHYLAGSVSTDYTDFLNGITATNDHIITALFTLINTSRYIMHCRIKAFIS